jgi:hypothetical protein
MGANKKILMFFLTIVAVIIVLCCGLIAFTKIDAYICVAKAAQRIHVAPTYEALYSYIENSLIPGKTREEVRAIVKKIGPVSINSSTEEEHLQGYNFDSIAITMCLDPMNNIVLTASYDSNDLLELYWVDEFP